MQYNYTYIIICILYNTYVENIFFEMTYYDPVIDERRNYVCAYLFMKSQYHIFSFTRDKFFFLLRHISESRMTFLQVPLHIVILHRYNPILQPRFTRARNPPFRLIITDTCLYEHD